MRNILSLLTLCMLVLPLQAATIRGKVTDASGTAMPYVTISLSLDSVTIGGTTTGKDGSYRVESNRPAVVLRASFVGYATQEFKLQLGSQTDYTQNITLTEETNQLDDVTIVGNKKLIERRAGNIVMTPAASPILSTSNCSEILSKAPGVIVDKDGKILYNGKPVQVWIENRPSNLSGDQLKAYLENLNGSNVENVMIESQPSAKYDAEGSGTIIHIRLKHNKTQGFNGTVSAQYKGMYWRSLHKYLQDEDVSLNLNYLGKHSYSSLMVSQQYGDQMSTTETTTTTPEAVLNNYTRSRSWGHAYMVRFTQDFYIDSTNTLGYVLMVMPFYARLRNNPENNYSEQWCEGVLSQTNTDDQDGKGQFLQHSVNLNFTHTFSREREAELRVNVDYDRNNEKDWSIDRVTYTGADPYNQETDNRLLTNIYSARMDYQTNFWQTARLTCGGKWMMTRTGYRSTLDSTTNRLTYTEQIAALYVEVSKQFGKHWNVMLGLRGEYTHSLGNWQSADSVTRKSYFNLFPSARVTYTPTENWDITLGYKRSIGRPDYWDLNPAVNIESSHAWSMGNPDLKPTYTHNLNFSAGYKFLSLDFNYSHMKDWINYKKNIQSSGDYYTQAVNYGKVDACYLSFSITEVPLGTQWLTWTSNVGVSYSHEKSYDRMLNTKSWMARVYASLTLHAPKDWSVAVDGNYMSPSTYGDAHYASNYRMDLGVKKDFPKIGLTITMGVKDLLLSSKWRARTLGLAEGYSSTENSQYYNHSVSISIVYRFGQMFEHREHQSYAVDEDRQSAKSKMGQ